MKDWRDWPMGSFGSITEAPCGRRRLLNHSSGWTALKDCLLCAGFLFRGPSQRRNNDLKWIILLCWSRETQRKMKLLGEAFDRVLQHASGWEDPH